MNDQHSSQPLLPPATGTKSTPGVTTTQETPFSAETIEESKKKSKTLPTREGDIVIHKHTIRREGASPAADNAAGDNTQQRSPDVTSPR